MGAHLRDGDIDTKPGEPLEIDGFVVTQHSIEVRGMWTAMRSVASANAPTTSGSPSSAWNEANTTISGYVVFTADTGVDKT